MHKQQRVIKLLRQDMDDFYDQKEIPDKRTMDYLHSVKISLNKVQAQVPATAKRCAGSMRTMIQIHAGVKVESTPNCCNGHAKDHLEQIGDPRDTRFWAYWKWYWDESEPLVAKIDLHEAKHFYHVLSKLHPLRYHSLCWTNGLEFSRFSRMHRPVLKPFTEDDDGRPAPLPPPTPGGLRLCDLD